MLLKKFHSQLLKNSKLLIKGILNMQWCLNTKWLSDQMPFSWRHSSWWGNGKCPYEAPKKCNSSYHQKQPNGCYIYKILKFFNLEKVEVWKLENFENDFYFFKYMCLHAHTNVPLSYARLPTFFQQPQYIKLINCTIKMLFFFLLSSTNFWCYLYFIIALSSLSISLLIYKT